MNIILLMIPCTFLLVGGFVFAFLWASKNRQFDDLETPSQRMLIEDLKIKETNKITDKGKNNV